MASLSKTSISVGLLPTDFPSQTTSIYTQAFESSTRSISLSFPGEDDPPTSSPITHPTASSTPSSLPIFILSLRTPEGDYASEHPAAKDKRPDNRRLSSGRANVITADGPSSELGALVTMPTQIHVTIQTSSLASGISSGPTSTTTENVSPSRTSIIVPIQTPDPTQTSGGLTSPYNHHGALIGGVLGGLAFLALTLSLTFLYCRRRSVRWAPIFARFSLSKDREKAGTSATSYAQSLIAVPIPHDEAYQPPESKRDRLERIRREMEGAQRMREAFQLDLERRSANSADGDDAENGLERAEMVGIRAKIEQMGAMIAALQAEVHRQANEMPPPEYSAVVVGP